MPTRFPRVGLSLFNLYGSVPGSREVNFPRNPSQPVPNRRPEQEASLPSHPPKYAKAETQILGGDDAIVEINETMVGGRPPGIGVLAGRANKVYLIGIAECIGRVHTQTVKNTKTQSNQSS